MWRRMRVGLGVTSVLISSFLAVAGPAVAITSTDCDGLAAALAGAGNGDVITLDGICTGTFTLPDGVAFTFQGDPTDGSDGIDGPGEGTGPLLHGTNNGAMTIRNLVFTNGSNAGPGAGLSLTGNVAPTLDNLLFDGNDATGGTGEGGGLYLETNGEAVVSNSLFRGNTAGRNGGGAHLLFLSNGTGRLTGNVFLDNALTADTAPDHFGGGLYIERDNASPPEGIVLTQTDNLFDGNVVNRTTEGEAGGGGEWIVGAPTLSRYDTFTNNSVGNDTGEDTEGGGIGLIANTNGTALRLENAVVAGNAVDSEGGPGSGGGVYVGATVFCSPCDEVLTLHNSTVSGNTVTNPVVGPGVGGEGESDSMTVVNSIVAGNSSTGEGTADIAGFTTTTVSYSDACAGPGLTGGPMPGTGNICADPLLVDPFPGTADVHQTSAGPTIDKGDNASVPAELDTDMDGDARITDGDASGTATVDMGADESAAKEEPRPGDGVTPPGSIGENDGYCLGAADGGVFAFGNCRFAGAASAARLRAAAVTAPSGAKLNAPMIGLAMTPDNKGYWMASADGGVFTFGSAPFKGSLGGITLQQRIVAIAATPTGQGYWLVDSGGAVYGFGDAKVPGSTSAVRLSKPIVAMAATPSGQGYWLAAEDGGVFAFGDATFHGSTGSIRLNQPMIGIAVRPGGKGYWLVAKDGGVFSFGDSPFFGSLGAGTTRLNAPIVAVKSAATGNGYWLVGGDGGIFSFGSAPFRGSAATLKLNQPIVDMTG